MTPSVVVIVIVIVAIVPVVIILIVVIVSTVATRTEATIVIIVIIVTRKSGKRCGAEAESGSYKSGEKKRRRDSIMGLSFCKSLWAV